MKKVILFLLWTTSLICCCCKKTTSKNAKDTVDWTNMGPGQVNNRMSEEDSIAYSKLFRKQKPEDSFNNSKHQDTKFHSVDSNSSKNNYKSFINEIDPGHYYHFERINNLLRKRGLDICQFNASLDLMAKTAREAGEYLYPNDYLMRLDHTTKLQRQKYNGYFKIYKIDENDAYLTIYLFSFYSNLALCK